MRKENNFLIFIVSIALLTGCAKDPSYRGVSVNIWQQLSSEQKQLIVDRSFQEEINS